MTVDDAGFRAVNVREPAGTEAAPAGLAWADSTPSNLRRMQRRTYRQLKGSHP